MSSSSDFMCFVLRVFLGWGGDLGERKSKEFRLRWVAYTYSKTIKSSKQCAKTKLCLPGKQFITKWKRNSCLCKVYSLVVEAWLNPDRCEVILSGDGDSDDAAAAQRGLAVVTNPHCHVVQAGASAWRTTNCYHSRVRVYGKYTYKI